MGRGKRKDKSENKTESLNVRVNDNEREQVEQTAARLGLSVSDLVRKVIYDKARQLGLI